MLEEEGRADRASRRDRSALRLAERARQLPARPAILAQAKHTPQEPSGRVPAGRSKTCCNWSFPNGPSIGDRIGRFRRNEHPNWRLRRGDDVRAWRKVRLRSRKNLPARQTVRGARTHIPLRRDTARLPGDSASFGDDSSCAQVCEKVVYGISWFGARAGNALPRKWTRSFFADRYLWHPS